MFHSLTVYGVRRSVIAQQTFDFMDRALTLNNLIYGILTGELTAMRFARYATQEGTGTRSANRVMVGCHYPIIGAAFIRYSELHPRWLMAPRGWASIGISRAATMQMHPKGQPYCHEGLLGQ